MAVATKRKVTRVPSTRKTPQTQAIGERIKHGRELMGMTQPEFGEIMGVSWRTVQMWEYGEHPPYRHMRRIAEVLEQDVGWLLHGEAAKAEAGDKLAAMQEKLSTLDARSRDDSVALAEAREGIAEIREMLQQLLARE